MNVYDFDGTIYAGDCSIDFWRFCFQRNPTILKTIPNLLWSGIRYKFGEGSIEDFKSAFFSFLPSLPDLDIETTAFWDCHQKKIFTWYLDQKQSEDVVISASPEFLLEPICKRLDVMKPIATRMDIHSGKVLGINCKGTEKVCRFREQYPNGKIDFFYSDSTIDAPLAAMARSAILVQGDKLYPWPNK